MRSASESIKKNVRRTPHCVLAAMHPARLLPLLAVVTAATLVGTTTTAQPQVVLVNNFTCSATRNFTDDSPYANNLAQLLSALSSAAATATVDNWWFRSLTVGGNSNNINTSNASGLAMCWADADAARCRNCLATLRRSAAGDGLDYVSSWCKHSRNVSFASSGGCVIRYADAPFFGSADRSSGARIVLRSFAKAADVAGMREARGRLLSQLAETAGGAALRFANGSQGYVDATTVSGVRQVVYGMAQCTRDLPLSECTSCLLDNLAVMYSDVSVTNSTSAVVMGFSCYLRYQLDKPIDIVGLALPPSPPPTADENPAGSSAPPPLVGKTMLVAALAVAASAIITLLNA